MVTAIEGGARDIEQPRASSATSSSDSIGQLPVGASTALFSGLVQSFQQAIGSQSTSAVTAPRAAPDRLRGARRRALRGRGDAGAGQDLQAFQHSLVQALKQDGLTSNGTGNVVSSLQNLIQQLGPNGKPTAATETLTSTFQNLVNGVNGSAASGVDPSGLLVERVLKRGLQSFLNNLLQHVQASGAPRSRAPAAT